MPSIWQRHPRYAFLALLVFACTLYLFYPIQQRSVFKPIYIFKENTLANRLARSDHIYEKALSSRQDMIKKFGPSPKEIALFPPDTAPWPAYTVWDFFPGAYNCPHEVERVGTVGDGGRWTCGLSHLADKEDCIIYTFGNNYESTFEAEILDSTRHCQIWGYDYRTKSLGPDIPKAHLGRTHFRRFGLAGTDKHGPSDRPHMYTLESLIKLNGHSHIDILKVDAEGLEFEALTTAIKPYLESGGALPFGQLLIEIHLWGKSFAEFLSWWESLEAAGLRPFWGEPNLVYQNYNKHGTTDLAQYSFLNVKGDNVFITELRRSSSEQHIEHSQGNLD
ncbi:hypothetical protein L208DRAFT_841438 [Tricholoma matsutake]|nr:hypothetical protein L208DRAFT_841438 [Tricholoma matsutake 945]